MVFCFRKFQGNAEYQAQLRCSFLPSLVALLPLPLYLTFHYKDATRKHKRLKLGWVLLRNSGCQAQLRCNFLSLLPCCLFPIYLTFRYKDATRKHKRLKSGWVLSRNSECQAALQLSSFVALVPLPLYHSFRYEDATRKHKKLKLVWVLCFKYEGKWNTAFTWEVSHP